MHHDAQFCFRMLQKTAAQRGKFARFGQPSSSAETSSSKACKQVHVSAARDAFSALTWLQIDFCHVNRASLFGPQKQEETRAKRPHFWRPLGGQLDHSSGAHERAKVRETAWTLVSNGTKLDASVQTRNGNKNTHQLHLRSGLAHTPKGAQGLGGANSNSRRNDGCLLIGKSCGPS